jgi:hypothetical protein
MIGREDLVDGKLETSAANSFTEIIIVFTDARTGDERSVNAFASDAMQHLGLLQRLVRAKNPMDAGAAQELANRAVAAGPPDRYGYVTLRLEQPLTHRNGSRPAAEIEEGDTVQVGVLGSEPLSVLAVISDPAERLVRVMLGAESHDERLEIQLALFQLEHGG